MTREVVLVPGREYAYAASMGRTGKLMLTRRIIRGPGSDAEHVASEPIHWESGEPSGYPRGPWDSWAERHVGAWGDPGNPTHFRDGRYVRLVREGHKLVEAK